jgi:hypothetical protein
MIKSKIAFSLLASASLALSSVAFGGSAKDYQVTGPILEMNDSMIAVEKGKRKERWEIARDSNTKSSGEMKVGDKVTVHYIMTATNIEAKAAKADKGKKEEAKTAASPTNPQ